MERDIVKTIVYQCASEQFYDKNNFYTKMSQSPKDGEDLLLYDEVGFDSLDMVEFILAIETYFKFGETTIQLPDDLFDNEVTLGKVIDYIWKTLNNK